MAYRRKDVPAGLHYNQNPREGDPVIIATGPYAIRAHEPPPDKPDNPPSVGAWIRSANDAADEGKLLCRRPGYVPR